MKTGILLLGLIPLLVINAAAQWPDSAPRVTVPNRSSDGLVQMIEMVEAAECLTPAEDLSPHAASAQAQTSVAR